MYEYSSSDPKSKLIDPEIMLKKEMVMNFGGNQAEAESDTHTSTALDCWTRWKKLSFYEQSVAVDLSTSH